jgi:hypothetical protein
MCKYTQVIKTERAATLTESLSIDKQLILRNKREIESSLFLKININYSKKTIFYLVH